jgi:hypothetical protein
MEATAVMDVTNGLPGDPLYPLVCEANIRMGDIIAHDLAALFPVSAETNRANPKR